MGRTVGSPGRELLSVVMVDFNGVLQVPGTEFWDQARARGDEVASQLDHGMDLAFHAQPDIGAAWMRGELDATGALRRMGVDLTVDGLAASLLRELADSIAGMPVDAGVAGLLSSWRGRSPLFLATDNIAEMSVVFEKARVSGDGGDLTLAGAAPLFDGIVCSAATSALKRDPGGAFFRGWAAEHALPHPGILLIDDREVNCAAWKQAGGAAIRWELGQDPLDDLDEAVTTWLGQREQLADRAASDRTRRPAAGGAP